MAEFCLATGRSKAEYEHLTRLEREAFMTRAEQMGLITRKR